MPANQGTSSEHAKQGPGAAPLCRSCSSPLPPERARTEALCSTCAARYARSRLGALLLVAAVVGTAWAISAWRTASSRGATGATPASDLPSAVVPQPSNVPPSQSTIPFFATPVRLGE